MPREHDPLADAGAHGDGFPRPLLLKSDAHEQQRDRGARIGTRVGEKGNGPADLEERPSERRPDDAHERRGGRSAPQLPRGAARTAPRRAPRPGGRRGRQWSRRLRRSRCTRSPRTACRRARARVPTPPIAAARAASAPTMRARRLQWSAATPAGMASAAIGTARANDTRPALAAECVRASTRSGYAMADACVPTFDSSCPVWSNTNFRLRRSGSGGTGRRTPSLRRGRAPGARWCGGTSATPRL